MIHLNSNQYPALNSFRHLVRKDILNRNFNTQISPSVQLIGQEYGFCNDDIKEIIEECYEELTYQKINDHE